METLQNRMHSHSKVIPSIFLLSSLLLVSCHNNRDDLIKTSIDYLNKNDVYFCSFKNRDKSFSDLKNYSTYVDENFDFDEISFFYLSININEDKQYLTKETVNQIHDLLKKDTYIFISFFNAGNADFLKYTDFDNGKHVFNTSQASVNVWSNSGKATNGGKMLGYSPSPVDYENHDYYVFSVLSCCENLVKDVRGSM